LQDQFSLQQFTSVGKKILQHSETADEESGALVRPVDEHGKASGADNFFLAFMVAGEIHPRFVIGTAYKTLQFFSSHIIPPGR
jgi:hypothetical protein